MSLSSLFATVETDCLNAVQAAESDVAAWWKGFAPIVESDMQKFVSVVGPIVLKLVETMALAAITGPAKFAIVSAAAIATAEASGITASKTMADTLVQQTVASVAAAANVKAP